MQKYQGNSTNAPRETFIGDQRHMLAYINPFEEDLLRNYGGTGQAGPGGVPAFRPVKGKDSSGKSSAGTGFSGGSSNNNSGGGGGGGRQDGPTSDQVSSRGSSYNDQANVNRINESRGGGNNNNGGGNNNNGGGNNNNGGGNNNNVGVASSIGTTATGPVVPSGQTQAQTAMDRFGSRANNPQTVSEIMMAQQSLRDLASTSTPPIQSMTKTAELVTNDAGQQPYSMGSTTVPTSQLSNLELSLEFDEDYQDAKSQLEAAGYVVDENGIVRTTTGESVGPLSEVVNFGRANPDAGGPAGFATAAPLNHVNDLERKLANKLDVALGTGAPPVIKAGPPVKKVTALDAEREIALAGGFSYFKSSDGKFYTTDPNAPKELQDALAQRSVAYTPKANPTAFNADGTPRGGIFGFANIADMFDMGGRRASGNTYSDGPLAGYGNALGIRPPGLSDKDWEKTKAQQQLMRESKMGAFAQRPDFSKYPETGFPDPAQSTDGFGGDSYQGGGDNQGAAPAPAPIIDPCPEGYVLKDGACVLAETDPLGGFPSLTPRLPQGPTVVGNPGYTPVGGGVAPRLNPYPQQMPIMAPPPGLAGARVGEAGILDLLRAANR
jgi:hypothetical protein